MEQTPSPTTKDDCEYRCTNELYSWYSLANFYTIYDLHTLHPPVNISITKIVFLGGSVLKHNFLQETKYFNRKMSHSPWQEEGLRRFPLVCHQAFENVSRRGESNPRPVTDSTTLPCWTILSPNYVFSIHFSLFVTTLKHLIHKRLFHL